MENNLKKIIKNYLYNSLYQIFTLITPLVTTPYISRVLGVENIGIYGYSLSITTYFMVMGSLGIPLYAQREIAIIGEDKNKRSIFFYQIILVQAILVIITIVIYLIIIIKFTNKYKEIYLLQIIGLFGYAFAISWFYMGIEKFDIVVKKNIIVKLFSIATIFIFVNNREDLAKYTFLMGISNLIGNIIIIFDLKKYIYISNINFSLKKIISHIKPAFILGIPYYMTTIYSILDKTMLGFISSGYIEVGYYEQTQKIIGLALSFITVISTVLLPRITNEVSNNDRNKIKTLINLGLDFIFMFSLPIMTELFVMGEMIVPWFLGLEFNKVGDLIKISSPLILIIGINSLLGNQYLIATRREKKLIYIIFIGIIINCIFNFVLISKFNSSGVIFSTIFSEIIKLIIILIYIKKEIKLTLINEVRIKYFLAAMLMFLLLVIVKNNFNLEYSILNTLFLIIIGLLIYIVELIIFRDKYLYSLFKNLGKILLIKKKNYFKRKNT